MLSLRSRRLRRLKLTSLCPCGNTIDDAGSAECDIRDRCEKSVDVVLQRVGFKVKLWVRNVSLRCEGARQGLSSATYTSNG